MPAKVRDQKTIRGAEVGVYRGVLSANLLGFFPSLHLWMIDPWETIDEHPTMERRNFQGVMKEAIARTDFASKRRHVIVECSPSAARHFSGMELDFVFIDAAHLYEFVKNDLKAFGPLVCEDGLMSGHDYNGRGDRNRAWGVKRAVDEWAAEHGLEIQTRGINWWTVLTRRIEG